MEEKVEVVIKIPKYYLTCPEDFGYLAECVRRGITLPKGHGRLIDADALPLQYIDEANHGSNFIKIAPTIIEADEGHE